MNIYVMTAIVVAAAVAAAFILASFFPVPHKVPIFVGERNGVPGICTKVDGKTWCAMTTPVD